MLDYLASDYWYIKDDRVLFLSLLGSKLIEYDIISGRLIYLGDVPDKKNMIRLYSRCVKFDNYIYCFPDNGDMIWKFDKYNNSWSKVVTDIFNGVSRPTVHMCQERGELLYLFSEGIKSLILFNMKNGTIERVFDSYKISKDISRIEYANDDIFFSNKDESSITRINICDGNSNAINLPFDDGKGVFTISRIKNELWMTGYKKSILIFDIEKGSGREIPLPKKLGEYNIKDTSNKNKIIYTDTYDNPLFYKSYYLSGFFWLIPFYSNMILYIEPNSEEIRELYMIEEEETEISMVRELKHKFLDLGVYNNRFIYLYSLKNNNIVCIDTVSKNYNRIKLDVINIMDRLFSSEKIINEGSNFSLKTYISYLSKV